MDSISNQRMNRLSSDHVCHRLEALPVGREQWQSLRARELSAEPLGELMRRLDEVVLVLARQAAALNGLELQPRPRADELAQSDRAHEPR